MLIGQFPPDSGKARFLHFTTSPNQQAKIQEAGKVNRVSGASHIVLLEVVIGVSGRRTLAALALATAQSSVSE